MIRSAANVAGIGTIIFENGKARIASEGHDVVEIIASPLRAEAGHHAIASGAPLGVVFRVGSTARCKQGVATESDAFGTPIVGEFFIAIPVSFVSTFKVKARTEGHDDHFEADFRGLIDGLANGGGITLHLMKHQWVFVSPWSDGAIHFSPCQSPTLTFARILQ